MVCRWWHYEYYNRKVEKNIKDEVLGAHLLLVLLNEGNSCVYAICIQVISNEILAKSCASVMVKMGKSWRPSNKKIYMNDDDDGMKLFFTVELRDC